MPAVQRQLVRHRLELVLHEPAEELQAEPVVDHRRDGQGLLQADVDVPVAEPPDQVVARAERQCVLDAQFRSVERDAPAVVVIGRSKYACTSVLEPATIAAPASDRIDVVSVSGATFRVEVPARVPIAPSGWPSSRPSDRRSRYAAARNHPGWTRRRAIRRDAEAASRTDRCATIVAGVAPPLRRLGERVDPADATSSIAVDLE